MTSDKPANRRRATPNLHHMTFITTRLDEMVRWYELVVGLKPHYYDDEAVWLTDDAANHSIAFLAPPGLKHPVDKGHTTGLHHMAFEYADFDQWLDNYIYLRDQGIIPFLTLDHCMAMSLYYQDPDGNGVEIQVDAFGDWAKSTRWLWSSLEFADNPDEAYFDPDKLVAARAAGLNFEEIHRRTRAGDYVLAEVPADILLPNSL
jgi:catechol 2,3-dioxygenase